MFGMTNLQDLGLCFEFGPQAYQSDFALFNFEFDNINFKKTFHNKPETAPIGKINVQPIPELISGD